MTEIDCISLQQKTRMKSGLEILTLFSEFLFKRPLLISLFIQVFDPLEK